MTEPVFPPGLIPGRRIGEGRRSVVYHAAYRGETLAVKVYRQAFIDKYQARYGINIAEFEMARNRAVRSAPGLKEFTARPIGVIGLDGQCSLAFLQEFIEGVSLVDLGLKNGGLPDSVLAAGGNIVQRAEAAGLHDLDLYYRNILLVEKHGEWRPMLHDFNLVPQHEFPPNPFLALAYRTGLRKKSHRDYRCIRQWREFSDSCANPA